jgi:hypothetical protein
VRDDWVATEEIHGAQLVLATDGSSVAIGKRKAWLREDEAFFGWQLLRAELERGIRALHEAQGRTRSLYLYGELLSTLDPPRPAAAQAHRAPRASSLAASLIGLGSPCANAEPESPDAAMPPSSAWGASTSFSADP